ncbi:hypothetical protein A0123_03367 [Gluconobacter cerinus]|uniref:Uncharacterized protein n=1 Tax=Gluconobacter cerinus TaxID=38307 RepID=A0A1B6VFM8_9PROT|nr:hypothetical protein A0123_03367 [Gluconobacter cerinus]
MTKLKLGRSEDLRPVRVMLELLVVWVRDGYIWAKFSIWCPRSGDNP